MMEVIQMIQVVNVIKRNLVVVQAVNDVDQNRNHQVIKRVVVQNVVHHVQNQKIMIMVMIKHQIIQKQVHHHQQDVMVIMIIKVEMKVIDE
jgi:hypothetical protein